MFQAFHLDVAKVDLGVAHVAMVIHAYFKCLMCLQTYVVNVSTGCFKIDLVLHMLQCAMVAGHHLPVPVTSSFGARPPGTTQLRGMAAGVGSGGNAGVLMGGTEGAGASECKAWRGVDSCVCT